MFYRRIKTISLIALAVTTTGCPTTTSEGLDLSVRGILSMTIGRESTSAGAFASAHVNDTGPLLPFIDLAADQTFAVNGVMLNESSLILGGAEYTSTIGAVNAPSGYSIQFNDRGVIRSMAVTPPHDFTGFSPPAGSVVSRQGFSLTWTPSGENDVTLSIRVSGTGADGDYDDTTPDPVTVFLDSLPDTGVAQLGLADLQGFLDGAITLSAVRNRSTPQELGFARGSVVSQITKSVPLTLGN